MITPSFSLTATERVLPAMALDFTTASLDGRVTFTRALATATRTNSSGLIEAVAADTARFDYDPVTLDSKGLLIEEARTNLLTYSEDFDNAAWSKTRSSITPNAVTAPDGTLTADKLIEDSTASASHSANRGVVITTGTTYTFSLYIKASERTQIAIQLGSDAFGATQRVMFDTTTGLATLETGTATSTMTAVGNGWYRCTMTAAATASVTSTFLYYLYNGSTSYTGDGTSGIYIWGAQLEAGAFATSYIPTTSAALTRNADVATMTGTDFSDWFNASEGTFSVTATVPAITGLNMRFISANDGTSSNRIDLYGITDTQLRVVNSGSVQASVTSGTIASYQERTSVGAYKADSFATATNADSVSTDTSGTVPTVDQLYIGRATVSNATYCNGTIKQINYWQQRLTDNEVVAFSKGL